MYFNRLAALFAVLLAVFGAQPAAAQTPTVSFAQAAYTQNENSSVDIPVTLSAAAAADVTITYTVGGTARSDDPHYDFGALSGTLAIASGGTTANISVSVFIDDYRDPDETITLTLSAPNGYAEGSIAAATITITDTTPDVRVHFNPTHVRINETDDSVQDMDTGVWTPIGFVQFEALNDHPEYSFQVQTRADGQVIVGNDLIRDGEAILSINDTESINRFLCRSFILAFSRNVNVIAFPNQDGIDPFDDDLVEHDEGCTMTLAPYEPLSADKPYAVVTTKPEQAGGTWKLTIVDDDRDSATIAFGSDAAATATYAATAAEADGTLNVPVTISHAPGAATTFVVEDITTAGAATEGAGGDYTIADKMLVFPAEANQAARTQNIVITLNDDTLAELDEEIMLRLRAADDPVDDLGDYYTRNAAATAQITISSEDAAPPVFTVRAGPQTLTLDWTPDPASGAAGTYLARWRLADAGSGTPGSWENTNGAAGVDTQSQSTYAITGLTNGSAYEVQMASVTDSGTSDWSQAQSQVVFTLDVDGKTGITATDGLLLARYLFGVRGDALTAGLSGEAESGIIANLDAAKAAGVLNVDGDGESGWKDGVLYARYTLGLRGDALTNGITTTDAQTVEGNIESSLPAP